MASSFYAENAAWGNLIDIIQEEPYIYLDSLYIWEKENKEKILIKPFPEYNIRMQIEYDYI